MNKCGDCTVCCEVWDIPQLQKPEHELCSHCIGSGCGIYENRPKVCIDFKCAYLLNDWGVSFRPDMCGVMIVAYKGKDHFSALRIRDEVSDDIMQYIKDIQVKNKNIKIKGVDARQPVLN